MVIYTQQTERQHTEDAPLRDEDRGMWETLLPIFNEEELEIVRENMKHWRIRGGWVQWVENEGD